MQAHDSEVLTTVSAHAPVHAAWALEFGDFHLMPHRRLLLRRGVDVRIGGRAFDVLVALTARPGQVISHRELMQVAWPNRVVCDCNVKVQIANLQRTLGRSAGGRRFIENVALRGYIFVDSVRIERSDNPSPMPISSHDAPRDEESIATGNSVHRPLNSPAQSPVRSSERMPSFAHV